MRHWKRHLPNAISATRVPLGILTAYCGSKGYWVVCAGLLTAGFVSDFLDGWAAKKFGVESPGARWVDPLCDAALYIGAGFGLALYPGEYQTLLWGCALVLLPIVVVLKYLKEFSHQEKTRLLFGNISFEIATGFGNVVAFVYGYLAFEWFWTGILLSILFQSACRYLKRERLARLHAIGY